MEWVSKVSSTIVVKWKKEDIQVYSYIVDETIIKVGSQYIWLWVAIMP
jgi:transposase-like protein